MRDDLRGLRYFDMRDNLARDLRLGIAPQRIEAISDHVRVRGGLTRGEAAAVVERFFADLARYLTRR